MLKRILAVLLSLFLGLATGIGIVKLTSPKTTVEEILYSPLGKLVKKPQAIGFLPYWLVNTAQSSYQNYLTTLTYFGLTIGPDGHIVKLINPQEEEPGWTTFKKESVKNMLAQAKADKLKTSLLIFTINEDDILDLINTPEESAQNLLNDVVPLMQESGFTDLNMDIESFDEASPASQLNYAEFLKEVKRILGENDLGTLTVDITPESLIKPRLTDISLITPIVDYVVLMGYDYHYIYSLRSGPVAPIGGAGNDREYDVETAVKLALQTVPPEKLILGIPLYGYEWDTVSDFPSSPIVPGTGKTASTRRVEEILKDCPSCRGGFDEKAKEPYLIIPEGDYFRQIFYENSDSLGEKLTLAKEYKLGGVAFWALGYEDSTILNALTSYR